MYEKKLHLFIEEVDWIGKCIYMNLNVMKIFIKHWIIVCKIAIHWQSNLYEWTNDLLCDKYHFRFYKGITYILYVLIFIVMAYTLSAIDDTYLIQNDISKWSTCEFVNITIYNITYVQ